MIAVCVATRGLMFTETDIAIDEIAKHFNTQVIRTYDKPIPDAQNWLTDQAIELGADYVLYIEEDMVPTLDMVREMVNRDTDIAFVDYSVNGWSCSAKSPTGEVLWCGLGCTLVKRCVFDRLKKPYFRTDKSFRLNDWTWIDNPSKYGGQDIWFMMHAREAGFRIVQIPGEVDHLGIKALGQKETNNGSHNLYVKPKIKNYQIIEREE